MPNLGAGSDSAPLASLALRRDHLRLLVRPATAPTATGASFSFLSSASTVRRTLTLGFRSAVAVFSSFAAGAGPETVRLVDLTDLVGLLDSSGSCDRVLVLLLAIVRDGFEISSVSALVAGVRREEGREVASLTFVAALVPLETVLEAVRVEMGLDSSEESETHDCSASPKTSRFSFFALVLAFVSFASAVEAALVCALASASDSTPSSAAGARRVDLERGACDSSATTDVDLVLLLETEAVETGADGAALVCRVLRLTAGSGSLLAERVLTDVEGLDVEGFVAAAAEAELVVEVEVAVGVVAEVGRLPETLRGSLERVDDEDAELDRDEVERAERADGARWAASASSDSASASAAASAAVSAFMAAVVAFVVAVSSFCAAVSASSGPAVSGSEAVDLAGVLTIALAGAPTDALAGVSSSAAASAASAEWTGEPATAAAAAGPEDGAGNVPAAVAETIPVGAALAASASLSGNSGKKSPTLAR